MPSPHSRGRRSNKSKKGTAQRQRTAPVQPAASRSVPVQPAATAAAAPKRPAAVKAPPRVYALPEYPYVTGDLTRIGIIAAVLIVILIILSNVL